MLDLERMEASDLTEIVLFTHPAQCDVHLKYWVKLSFAFRKKYPLNLGTKLLHHGSPRNWNWSFCQVIDLSYGLNRVKIHG